MTNQHPNGKIEELDLDTDLGMDDEEWDELEQLYIQVNEFIVEELQPAVDAGEVTMEQAMLIIDRKLD